MKWRRSLSFLAAFLFLWAGTPAALAEDNTAEDELAAPTAVVLTRFDEPDRTDAAAFAVGTSPDDLALWFADDVGGFTGYDAQDNPYDLRTGAWSLETVDTGTPGVYYAAAFPDLSDGYVLENGVTLPRQLCAVSIQTPGKPDINCCVSARGFLHFPWVLSPEQQEQLEQFTVRLRKDDGAWTPLSNGAYFTSEDLQLSQRIFELNSTYDLQVFYPGGHTGILTFRYDDELHITDYSSGDRDGGDVNGSGSSAGTQPAPAPAPTTIQPNNEDDDEPSQDVAPSSTPDKPSSEPANHTEQDQTPEQTAVSHSEPDSDVSAPKTLDQGDQPVLDNTNTKKNNSNDADTPTKGGSVSSDKPTTVQESYSPTQTVISGLRLRDLCADEKSVVFGQGDLTVSIPSELLLALNLNDNDTLSVKMTQPQSDRITLAVDAAGSVITALPGTVLRLRYTPQSEDAAVTVLNEAGEKTADAEYDGEFLRFAVNATGTYTISQAAAVPEEFPAAPGSTLPMLPLVGGGLVLTAGGTVLVRRKLHG